MSIGRYSDCYKLLPLLTNPIVRLAPEHPFPVPFEDTYAAVKWVRTTSTLSNVHCYNALLVRTQVAENASLLGVSLTKGFIVGGDSAGANIAAAVALRARDDSFFVGRPLTGQYLREPPVVHPNAWPEE